MHRGEKEAPLGDEEPVSGDAQRGVMMEASPAPAFEVAQAEFLVEFFIIAFHDPTMLGDSNQVVRSAAAGKLSRASTWLARPPPWATRSRAIPPGYGSLCLLSRCAGRTRTAATASGVSAALPPSDLFHAVPGRAMHNCWC